MNTKSDIIDWLSYYYFPKELINHINSLEVKPKLVFSKTVCNLFLHANGVTLYPNIYVPTVAHMRRELLNHELIHWFQEREIEHFYLAYMIETLCNGYRKNRFEKEAYLNERNVYYTLKFIK